MAFQWINPNPIDSISVSGGGSGLERLDTTAWQSGMAAALKAPSTCTVPSAEMP
jgi:hypothetical protein